MGENHTQRESIVQWGDHEGVDEHRMFKSIYQSDKIKKDFDCRCLPTTVNSLSKGASDKEKNISL